MASETITRNDLKAIFNEMLPPTFAGITPDYARAVTISSLPYTAPDYGIIIYKIGDGTNAGERDLIINGVEVARARATAGVVSTTTIFVSKGDTVSGGLGIWGYMKFIPCRLTIATNTISATPTSPLIQVVTTSTLTGTGSGNMTYNCPTVAGYSCIGALGYSASGTTAATTSMYDIWIDVANQKIRISRTDALSSSYGLVVRLLYVKDGSWTS